MNVIVQKDFEPEEVLKKPLMAHLLTVENGEPRDSPVWFLWEEGCLWIVGTAQDSFIRQLKKGHRCAVGVVDFDLDRGVLKHVGIRGETRLGKVDKERLQRHLSKYLGEDQAQWNQWFIENITCPLEYMVQVIPKTIVAKNVSYFKTGPNLAM
ncbi:MAG: pyridoxamine 5'-phosphate oxidase family protein [Myxococcales bacterium]|nr:pyridoxamine 5'-phosphate oxidase family protein [Myxococcales bacterium]USN51661.1 MAG: pyridoxamine 5'-phosphate oxidase family protein [Myxococcales bacterium]